MNAMQAITIALSIFLAGLFPSIINSNMDYIQGALAFSNDQKFLVQFSGLAIFLLGLLISTDLQMWVGARRFALLSAAILMFSSLGAALVSTYGLLVIFYVTARFGCACLVSFGLTQLSDDRERRRRGRMLSIIFCVYLVASGIGPILGQWAIDAAGWRYMFLAMAPIALMLLILQAAFVARRVG